MVMRNKKDHKAAVAPKMRAATATLKSKQTVKKSNPDMTPWPIGICRVMQVNYEEMLVTLRTITGTSEQFTRVPVPLAMPGVGQRHFLGAMPEVGDLCLCGWMAQSTMTASSTIPTRIPVVLNWLPRGPWLGQDWLIEAPFAVDESDFSTSRQQLLLEGVFQRTRHKARHMQPGNVLASSGQGSDLILDESATLANRRGNEIRLRDQDQALVTRSLQQFHAMAGARIYGGMVQRDATLLATTMISDGLLWDGARQLDKDGRPYWGGKLNGIVDTPYYSEGLPNNPDFPNNYLQPSRILARKGSITQPPILDLSGSTRLDPYVFLGNGLLIDDKGYVLRSQGVNPDGGTGYGGKRMFRTALLSDSGVLSDGTTNPNTQTFTEYRIEISHTADGTLPVTEQTDGFDADRLPEQAAVPNTDQPANNTSRNAPYITSVMGTVVGNDPYTYAGRKVYGLPLVPIIFGGGTPSVPTPNLISALSPPVGLGEQAATLFSLTPVGPDAGPNTFWSLKKNGQLRANIGGPADGNSVEFATTGNLAGYVGGSLDILVGKAISINSEGGNQTDNTALNLSFPKGTVRLYAGGAVEGPAASTANASDQAGGASNLPSMQVAGRNVEVAGDQRASLQAADTASVNSKNAVQIQGGQTVAITGGQKLTQTGEQVEITATGKMVVTLAGPKNLSPTSGPVRETVVQSALGGTVDKYSVPVTGDREEEFTAGSHTTSIKVGNMTYQTQQGYFLAKAGQTFVEVSSVFGVSAYAQQGYASLSANSGPASVTGQTSASLTATAGVATVKGTTVVLSATGGKVGGIMSGADIEPFTGQPFALLGCGSPTQLLSPV